MTGRAAVLLIAGGMMTIGAAPARSFQDGTGWTLGSDAAEIRNPLAPTAEIMARGADLYGEFCQRCHGRSGRGNGPDADPDDPPRDLTDPARASRNPDGVLFYKVWYGRRNPRMPAFRNEMDRDEVWAVVHYVTSLRVPRRQ